MNKCLSDWCTVWWPMVNCLSDWCTVWWPMVNCLSDWCTVWWPMVNCLSDWHTVCWPMVTCQYPMVNYVSDTLLCSVVWKTVLQTVTFGYCL